MRRYIKYFAAFSFFICAIAYNYYTLHVAPENETSNLLLEALANNISKIQIYNRRGDQLISEIDNTTAVNNFSASLHDAKHVSLNHPGFTKHWYLRIFTRQWGTIELECSITNDSRLIYGVFVTKRVGSTQYNSKYFTSTELRKWFNKNLN